MQNYSESNSRSSCSKRNLKGSLSNSMIGRLIDDMSHAVEEVLSDILKNNSFAIHVDESFDITNACYVVDFVQPRVKIYLTFCLHIWKQKVCLGRIVLASVLVVPHQLLAPWEAFHHL